MNEQFYGWIAECPRRLQSKYDSSRYEFASKCKSFKIFFNNIPENVTQHTAKDRKPRFLKL